MDKLHQEIIAKIKPSGKEHDEFVKSTDNFLKILNQALKTQKTQATAILGGSGAKGTWLSGNHDVDIFVRFEFNRYKKKNAELSDILEGALKRAFAKEEITKLHGSRDYFQLHYQNLKFEVIPIIDINKAEEALNITDISPLHAQWVKKKANENIKNEILLAKQFFKANCLYGAESHITGFSGYVLEILVINFGSFSNLLKAAVKWNVKEIIDPSKFYQKKTALFHLNKSKLNSPLIVIDPVDKSRNAAAALSLEKFNLLKKLAKEYLKKPDKSYFSKKTITLEQLKGEAKKNKLNLAYLELLPLEGKEDVVGTKLLKSFEFLKKELSGFGVAKAEWHWEVHDKKALFYFLLKKKELPKFETRIGPPLELKDHVKMFQEMHKDAKIKDGRITAEIKTKNPKLKDYLNNLLTESYVKEKIKKINHIGLY